MNRSSLRSAILVCLMVAAFASRASAQGVANSSLSGTIVDSSGAVLPGAAIVAKNTATSVEFQGVSNEKGEFNIPAMPPGTYTVTVSLMGFKTVALSDVKLDASVPSTIKAALEVGRMEETITVTGGSDIVQTQSTQVATTMNVKQISSLPLQTRNLMDALTMLPGVSTPGTPRNSTINGLPQSAINITLDGVNVQDNYLKGQDGGDGFFALISPRLDAIEEVTVSTATPEAGNAGQGSAQVAFVTRSGTNNFQGSVYEYYRDPKFNSNYWFNNRDLPADPKTGKAPKDQVKLQQYGVRFGGPIMLPGFDGHDRAFFFVNYERYHQPNEVTRQRTVLNPLAVQGIFQYTTSGGATQPVNLYTLAAQNGHTSTSDPTVLKLLTDIQSAMQKRGGVAAMTDPNIQRYTYTNKAKSDRYYPTVRFDYNLTKNNRLSVSSNYQNYNSDPDTLNNRDPQFPEFPNTGSQTSKRITFSASGRSTLSPRLVNEARVGYTNSKVKFSQEIGPSQFTTSDPGGQAGFNLSLSSACCGNNTAALANATASAAPSQRMAPNLELADTLNWNRGAHNYTMGASWQQVSVWLWNQTVVPQIQFAPLSGDPAAAMFTQSNFPGASTTQLSNAQGIYSLLTGRMSAINGNAILDENAGKYAYQAPLVQRGRMHELGVYAQDNWRWKPNFTVNYGLRWEPQLPFYALNNVYTVPTYADLFGVSGVGNVFEPGVFAGQKPTYQAYPKGQKGFNADLNNFAPNLGLAWRPSAESGFLRRLFGEEGDTVLRAAYALSYERPGMADYTDVFSGNQGATVSANRSTSLGNLGTLPVLLRNGNLGPGAFPDQPSFPITPLVTSEMDLFNPDIQSPYTQSWTAGIQRALSRNDVIEVRYVGNRHLQGWIDYNYNEINIVENKFLDEFKLAMGNLRANQAAGAGRGCIGGSTASGCQNNFAYTGAPGTVPLPTFLGFLNGLPSSRATDPTAYSGGNWTNSTFLGFLTPTNPSPYGFASTNSTSGFIGNATLRTNGLNAGIPSNYFIVNPDVIGGANYRSNGGYTRYDGMQIDYRRRLTHGFQLQANYTLSKAIVSNRYSLRIPRSSSLNTGTDESNVTHVFKMNWVYEMPFGRDRRFFSGASSALNHVIGGWEFDGVGRVQSGTILSFGNVRLVGMTDKDLQKAFTIRKDDANRIVYNLPQDIVDNTIRAFSTSATSATGYSSLGPPTGRYLAPANSADCIQVINGDCAPHNHFVTGPTFVRFDLSAVKRVDLPGHTSLQFRAEFLNAFNNINFIPVANIPSNVQTFSQVTAAYRDPNNTQDPGGRLVQFVLRFNW
jgi:hypothetical protein